MVELRIEEYLNTQEFKILKNLIEKKLNILNSLVISCGGYVLFKEERDKPFCRIIKSSKIGADRCKESILSHHLKVTTQTKRVVIYHCHAGFLGFCLPFCIDNQVLATLNVCQIIDAKAQALIYKKTIEELQIDSKSFLSAIENNAFKMAIGELELELETFFMFLSTSLSLYKAKKELEEKEEDVNALSEFYKLFEESRNLLFTLDTKKLYDLIVKLTVKTLNTEICSLMLVEKGSQDIVIKSAIGLSEEHIKKTKLKVGKGIVGYVIQTGQPLLVKDITKDNRFGKFTSSPKYYTESLISAPLKVGNEVLGVINVNNKATRKPFDERDLKLLSIICGHAAVAIKNLITKEEPQKKEIRQEMLNLKNEIDKIQEEKSQLIKEKEDIAQRVKDSEDKIEEKRLQIKEKEQMLQAQIPPQEVENLKKEMEKLKNELENLQKEKENLLKEVAEKENLIKEKERLEEEKRELLKEKEELEAQTEELAILYTISRDMPFMTSAEEILASTLEKIQPFFNYHASCYLFSENARLLSEIKQTCFLHTECLEYIKQTIQNKWRELNNQEQLPKISFTIKDLRAGELFWIGAEKFQSYLVSPLRYKGQTIGMIALFSFNEDAFSPLQRRVLTIICNQISVNLERVKLFLQIKEMAERDELTGVYNYRFFEELLKKEFSYASTYNKQICLIMLDFDYLKRFNDTYGHQEGNRLIKTICELIKEAIGDGGGSYLARYGGDEFAIILPEKNQNEAYNLAEKIRVNIASHKLLIKGKKEALSASLGVAAYPCEGVDSPEALLSKADKALYEAKHLGRNKVVLYNPSTV